MSISKGQSEQEEENAAQDTLCLVDKSIKLAEKTFEDVS